MGHDKIHSLGDTGHHTAGTLAQLNALVSDLIATYGGIRDIGVGTLAQRPAFGTANRFFYTTDEQNLYRDTGSAWEALQVAPDLHAASHTDGTDDIQSATNAQKGLATAAQIQTLEALDAIADIQEYHTVSAGEVTNGYFTLAQTPVDLEGVQVHVIGGVLQVSKQGTNIGSLTPDFDVLNGNELHFNNNGAATGLSGDIIENDVLAIIYRY